MALPGNGYADKVTMDHDTTCVPAILSAYLINPVGTTNDPHSFTTIQSAYDAFSTCATTDCLTGSPPSRDKIRLMATNFPETTLIFGDGKNITLEGGWDCDFLSREMNSLIKASVTIVEGSVVFDGIGLW